MNAQYKGLGTDHLICRGRGLWFFVSFRIFFRTTRVRIFIIFVAQSAKKKFHQNLTLGYMTKTLNQIIFFSSTKIRIFFKPYPSPLFKLNGRSLITSDMQINQTFYNKNMISCAILFSKACLFFTYNIIIF